MMENTVLWTVCCFL